MISPVVIAMGADQSRRQPIRSLSSLYGDTCQAGIHYPAHVAFTLMGRCDRAGFESAQGRRRAHPAITTDGHRITVQNPACKFSEAARPACKQCRADLSYRLPVVLAFQFFAPFVAAFRAFHRALARPGTDGE